MGLQDTLEKLFETETDVTLEAVTKEFVTAGDNIKSKTIIPFPKQIVAYGFLRSLCDNIDNTFIEVQDDLNLQLGIHRTIRGKPNPKYIPFSSSLRYILDYSEILSPTFEGLSRQQLLEAIKALRQETVIKKRDTLGSISEAFAK